MNYLQTVKIVMCQDYIRTMALDCQTAELNTWNLLIISRLIQNQSCMHSCINISFTMSLSVKNNIQCHQNKNQQIRFILTNDLHQHCRLNFKNNL